MALEAGTRLGPYQILAPIGAGGMGEVYRARDPRLGREVAVKVLPASFAGDQDRLKRLEREAHAAGALNHPNILAVHDVGAHEGAPYVVSELLEGETLRAKINSGVLPTRKATEYAVQIAHGLAAAHEKGIVHRDLKPENLFLTKDGRVKILDFGLARLRAAAGPLGHAETQDSTISQMTEAGTVLGTVGYMAPEQARGLPADARSDIFSFGAVLYEMVARRRAFQCPTAAETLAAILKEDPPELATPERPVPQGLERIVRRCLEKDPAHRFRSAHDLAFALEALTGTVPSDSSRTIPGRIRQPWARIAVFVGALLALGGAFLIGRRTTEPHRSPTWRQLTFRRGTVGKARFSPDGNTVYYSARWVGKPEEVFATRLDGVESRPLGLTGTALAAVVSGEMAVILKSEAVDPLLPARGRLARAPLEGGTPRPVIEDVEDADWLNGSDRLAVVRVQNEHWRLEYPVGTVLYEAPQPSRLGSPRLSPRGDRVAFWDYAHPSTSKGSMAVVDRSGHKQVLTDVFRDSAGGLAWSQDGREIWFTAGRDGTARALRAVSLSGRLRTLLRSAGQLRLEDVLPDGRVLLQQGSSRWEAAGLFPGDAGEHDYSWFDGTTVVGITPDGQTIAFQEAGSAGGRRQSGYLRRTDGSSPIRLGEGYPMSLSDDGRWVLFGVSDDAGGREFRLLPAGPGETRILSRGPIDKYRWGFFFPGGKRALIDGSEKGRPPRCFVQDLPDGPPRAVTAEGVTPLGTNPFIEPDGKSLAILGPEGPVLHPLEGSGPDTRIPGTKPGDVPLQRTRDGRFVFVREASDIPARVVRIDVRTGQRAGWKELAPADLAGVHDLFRIDMTPDGRYYVYSYQRDLSELYLVDGLQ
jgi:eukaryotic-like serine/threonine-protein kinase